jgi:hypothetical protein
MRNEAIRRAALLAQEFANTGIRGLQDLVHFWGGSPRERTPSTPLQRIASGALELGFGISFDKTVEILMAESAYSGAQLQRKLQEIDVFDREDRSRVLRIIHIFEQIRSYLPPIASTVQYCISELPHTGTPCFICARGAHPLCSGRTGAVTWPPQSRFLLCPRFFGPAVETAQVLPEVSRASILIHELSHVLAGTIDMVPSCRRIHRSRFVSKLRNDYTRDAHSYSCFVQELSRQERSEATRQLEEILGL